MHAELLFDYVKLLETKNKIGVRISSWGPFRPGCGWMSKKTLFSLTEIWWVSSEHNIKVPLFWLPPRKGCTVASARQFTLNAIRWIKPLKTVRLQKKNTDNVSGPCIESFWKWFLICSSRRNWDILLSFKRRGTVWLRKERATQKLEDRVVSDF